MNIPRLTEVFRNVIVESRQQVEAAIRSAVKMKLRVDATAIHDTTQREPGMGPGNGDGIYWVGLSDGGHADVIVSGGKVTEVHDRRDT